MKYYHFTGYGRLVNALGIKSDFTFGVEAENYEDAVSALYRRYEHISHLTVEVIPCKR